MSRGKKKRRPPGSDENAPTAASQREESALREIGKRLSFPSPKAKAGFVELVIIVALAFGLALAIQAWLLKPYKVPSQSMEPTLDAGQRFLVNRFTYNVGDPRVGDVIVFHAPKGADTNPPTCGARGGPHQACPRPTSERSSRNFVKRIVAGPGDKLSIRNGHPVVNGVEKVDEPYISPCDTDRVCNLPKAIVIPPNHYFMMGDNRGNSEDSRFWGPVPRAWIIGNVFATYWPPNRWGFF